jgi:hypothetical protein
MNKEEALKMAIEALDTLMMEKGSIYQQALQACKDALEQPAQEPVAWMSEGGVFTRTKEHAESWSNHGGKVTPVYTHTAPSWQGLSDDKIYRIYGEVQDNCVKDFPPELYAAWFKNTKEKNT